MVEEIVPGIHGLESDFDPVRIRQVHKIRIFDRYFSRFGNLYPNTLIGLSKFFYSFNECRFNFFGIDFIDSTEVS